MVKKLQFLYTNSASPCSTDSIYQQADTAIYSAHDSWFLNRLLTYGRFFGPKNFA